MGAGQRAIDALAELIGLDYDGAKLGAAYSDEGSGCADLQTWAY